MITAKEAKETAESIDKKYLENFITQMDVRIRNAALQGYKAITVPTLSDRENRFLESLGYKITYYSGDQRERESGHYTISW